MWNVSKQQPLFANDEAPSSHRVSVLILSVLHPPIESFEKRNKKNQPRSSSTGQTTQTTPRSTTYRIFNMTDLEQRISALEMGAKYDANQEVIRKREQEMLTTLREIRESMVKAGGGSSANSKELESLKTENEKLKATIKKQEYRIRHLIAGYEEVLKEEETAVV